MPYGHYQQLPRYIAAQETRLTVELHVALATKINLPSESVWKIFFLFVASTALSDPQFSAMSSSASSRHRGHVGLSLFEASAFANKDRKHSALDMLCIAAGISCDVEFSGGVNMQ